MAPRLTLNSVPPLVSLRPLMRLQILKANIIWSFIAAIFITSDAVAAEPWSALISAENSLEFGFLKNDTTVVSKQG